MDLLGLQMENLKVAIFEHGSIKELAQISHIILPIMLPWFFNCMALFMVTRQVPNN